MWVFGYGSLMWDGWERERGCLRRAVAMLRGHERSFNKLSVRNWGTPANPGPTLNLVAATGECRGIAFEFEDGARDAVLAYLTKREGKGFELGDRPIELPGGAAVQAIVPLYRGRNLAASEDLAALIQLARRARGSSGACADYILNVAAHLAELGIEDRTVAAIRQALQDSAPGPGSSRA